MRAKEIVPEIRKKKSVEPKTGDITPNDYSPGWEDLNWLKERGLSYGKDLSKSYQLFVPRRNLSASTPRDRRLKNLSDKYAWDDEGNLKPQYAKWEQPPSELKGTEPEIKEAAPILTPGKAVSPPGNNKPIANLWTSTAIKTKEGWTSDWAKWVADNQPDWFSNKGYLYKVKPGAVVLTLDSDQDAERIFRAFQLLGRASEPIDNYLVGTMSLTRTFPWDQIVKHFDAVWHRGYSRGREGFMYGWDVESVAWFDTSFLQLINEVNVAKEA